MIIPVHMFAFSNDRNLIRPVEIPDEKGRFAKLEKLLNLVFYYGQNDIPSFSLSSSSRAFSSSSSPSLSGSSISTTSFTMPSVSVGDVAEIQNEYFMVLPIGWKKISKDVFDILSPPTSSYAYGMSCTE